MRRAVRLLLPVLSSGLIAPFATAAAGAAADDDPRSFQPRDDRREGIAEPRRWRSVDQLVLVGARIESGEASPVASGDLRLAFQWPDSAEIAVSVEHFGTSYRMEPERTRWAAGPHEFAWPSEIVRDLELPLDDLVPLASVESRGRHLVAPVALYGKRPGGSANRYVFTFRPRASVLLFEMEVLETQGHEVVHIDTRRGLPETRPFTVSWTAQDADGKELPAGFYDLILKGTFRARVGRTGLRVVEKYRIHHDPELFRKLPAAEG